MDERDGLELARQMLIEQRETNRLLRRLSAALAIDTRHARNRALAVKQDVATLAGASDRALARRRNKPRALAGAAKDQRAG